MGIIKAVTTTLAKMANDIHYDKQKEKIPKLAYKSTGKKIKKAKKAGKYINGSKVYRNEKAKINEELDRNRDYTNNLIDKL